MKNKYYLVPVTAKAVKFNKNNLMDMLSVVDKELWMKEDYIIKLKYDLEDLSAEELELHKREALRTTEEVKAAFKLKKLPEKIIVVKDENGLHELATGLAITVISENYLDVFSISGEEVVEQFVANENYSNEAINFFNSFISKEKVLKKKIDK